MAEKLFLSVLNMGITSAWVILAILVVRLALRRLPAKYSYALWAVAGFRLLCPFSISSAVSLFNLKNFVAARNGNQMEYIPMNIGMAADPQVNLGAAAINEAVNNSLPAATPAVSVNPMQIWIFLGTCVWILGMSAMLIWALCSLVRVKKATARAVRLREDLREDQQGRGEVYECENIPSPFVLGLFRPKIYIPYRMDGRQREYILAHERCHIRRLDHWVKILAFLLLVVHWFNPFVWIAYLLMGKDMEMSCDEAVLSHYEKDVRAEYGELLLSFSTNHRHFSPGPLAFGESDVARRIKNVLRFRNPKLWMSVLGVVAVAVIAAVCVTNGSGESAATEEGTSMGEHAGESADSEVADENVAKPAGDGSSSGGAADDASQSDSPDENRISAIVEEQLQTWAEAFCERDGNALVEMCTDEVKRSFEERNFLIVGDGAVSFGMSSPWPWQAGEDYVIVEATDTAAEILYYAQTSDPHVTVWRETLEYQLKEDGILVEAEELRYMDYICTAEEFFLAYPHGIDGTKMDYLANGMGEALNNNALLSSGSFYRDLFEPDRAALYLLNLLDNPNKVEIQKREHEDGSVKIQINFTEDGGIVELLMIQPYGEQGIWIPQNALEENGLVSTERYSDYAVYEEMLGDGFLNEFYEMDMELKTDVVDGLGGESLEVYTGNIGDGDSGYVLIRDGNGALLYDEFAHAARAGWNNIYLCEDRWLMTLHMEDRDTFGEYSFDVFRLNEKGERVLMDQGSYTWGSAGEDDDDFEAFAEKLQGYLQESYLLLSTQEGELNTQHVSEAEKYSTEVLKKR